MSRTIRFILAVTLCSALLMAGEPWKSKNYTQWTKDDVTQILEDSPWAASVRVQPTWTSSSNPLLDSSPTRDRNIFSAPAARKDTTEDPRLSGVVFHIVWQSSRTVRQAQARSVVLAGKGKPEEAEKYVNQQPADYEVAIDGEDMTPFRNTEPAELRAGTALTPKSSKRPIAPTRVVLIPDARGYLGMAIFTFPKTEGGQPTIPPGEKRVEFTCKLAKNVLRANFDLTKMMSREGADF